MTDKQIIIDGVDVSGCRFYSEKLSTMNGTGSISVTKCNGFCTHNIRGLDDSSCYDAHIEYAKCKNNDCYYKQFKAENEILFKAIEEVNKINKRLESEKEELKKQLESTKGLVTVGNKQLAEALKENEDLKRTNKAYEQGIARLKDEKLELQDKNFHLEQNNYIKTEIVSSFDKMVGKYCYLKQTLAEIKEIAYGGYNNGQTSYATFQCEKIINKINEVENVNNNR